MCSSCCILLVEFASSVSSLLFFFFFKQKTAYEMRISDWSSDVCSSDLWTSRPGADGEGFHELCRQGRFWAQGRDDRQPARRCRGLHERNDRLLREGAVKRVSAAILIAAIALASPIAAAPEAPSGTIRVGYLDRKSTRLNSSP